MISCQIIIFHWNKKAFPSSAIFWGAVEWGRYNLPRYGCLKRHPWISPLFQGWYCWWTKSCTSWYGKYPIIYMVLYIPGGAGFCPPTVFLLDFASFWRTQIWLPFRRNRSINNVSDIKLYGFLNLKRRARHLAGCTRILNTTWFQTSAYVSMINTVWWKKSCITWGFV